MAIEGIGKEYEEHMKEKMEKDKNTINGCRINVVDDQVQVSIPFENEPKTLIFSKKDIKALFENLYRS